MRVSLLLGNSEMRVSLRLLVDLGEILKYLEEMNIRYYVIKSKSRIQLYIVNLFFIDDGEQQNRLMCKVKEGSMIPAFQFFLITNKHTHSMNE